MLIRMSKSVLVIGRPPSSQWRRWMSWASSFSSSWQRARSGTHRYQTYSSNISALPFLQKPSTPLCHFWPILIKNKRQFWPLEVASMSWVCCSQADTLLFTPDWVEAERAGLPPSCGYSDAESAYFRGWKQKNETTKQTLKSKKKKKGLWFYWPV